jgi:hypothetical protein
MDLAVRSIMLDRMIRVAPLALLLACGARVSSVDSNSDSGPTAPAPDGGSVQPAPDRGSAQAADVPDGGYAASSVAAAQAACNASHGDPYTPTGSDDFTSHLAGAWYLCSVNFAGGGQYPVYSIVLTGDGRWQHLLPDANGNLIPARGLDHEGTFTASDSSGSIGGQPTWMIRGPGDWFVRFEASPAHMRVDVATAGWAEWYVPLSR